MVRRDILRQQRALVTQQREIIVTLKRTAQGAQKEVRKRGLQAQRFASIPQVQVRCKRLARDICATVCATALADSHSRLIAAKRSAWRQLRAIAMPASAIADRSRPSSHCVFSPPCLDLGAAKKGVAGASLSTRSLTSPLGETTVLRSPISPFQRRSLEALQQLLLATPVLGRPNGDAAEMQISERDAGVRGTTTWLALIEQMRIVMAIRAVGDHPRLVSFPSCAFVMRSVELHGPAAAPPTAVSDIACLFGLLRAPPRASIDVLSPIRTKTLLRRPSLVLLVPVEQAFTPFASAELLSTPEAASCRQIRVRIRSQTRTDMWRGDAPSNRPRLAQNTAAGAWSDGLAGTQDERGESAHAVQSAGKLPKVRVLHVISVFCPPVFVCHPPFIAALSPPRDAFSIHNRPVKSWGDALRAVLAETMSAACVNQYSGFMPALSGRCVPIEPSYARHLPGLDISHLLRESGKLFTLDNLLQELPSALACATSSSAIVCTQSPTLVLLFYHSPAVARVLMRLLSFRRLHYVFLPHVLSASTVRSSSLQYASFDWTTDSGDVGRHLARLLPICRHDSSFPSALRPIVILLLPSSLTAPTLQLGSLGLPRPQAAIFYEHSDIVTREAHCHGADPSRRSLLHAIDPSNPNPPAVYYIAAGHAGCDATDPGKSIDEALLEVPSCGQRASSAPTPTIISPDSMPMQLVRQSADLIALERERAVDCVAEAIHARLRRNPTHSSPLELVPCSLAATSRASLPDFSMVNSQPSWPSARLDGYPPVPPHV